MPSWLAAQGIPSFSDQSQSAGLVFQHDPADDHLAGTMDGGATVGDFNADGWPDLFVIGGGTADRLFINQGNGTFQEQGQAWGVARQHRGTGVIAGDYNGDGWQDLFVTSFGPIGTPPRDGQHLLYRNSGQGTFQEVAVAAGVNFTSALPDGFSPVFGDYDQDGDLDLFVCAWFVQSAGNTLFRNNGDGTFSDVTDQAGLDVYPMLGFTPRFVDVDGDRYPELLVAADFGSTRYFRNLRNGTFQEDRNFLSGDLAYNGMGSAIADFDGDQKLDWFVSAVYELPAPGYPNGNRLYRQIGAHRFESLPAASGVHDGGWAWGCSALDFDHDGWQDLAVTNGWLLDAQWLQEPSYLFHNQQGNGFQEIALLCGFEHRGQGRGLYPLDYDRDGDLDVVITGYKEPVKLLRNDLHGTSIHWLQIQLDTSSRSNLAPNGLGSKVEITAGGRKQTAWIDGGPTYLGRGQLSAHFGLGAADRLQEFKVEWADGFQTVLRDLPADQFLHVAAPQPFQVEDLHQGQSSEFRLQGLNPWEFAFFLFSLNGAGEGPEKPLLGHRHLGLEEPIQVLGGASAGPNGVAVLNLAVPVNAPLVTLSLQAVVPRGQNGDQSVLSPILHRPILP